MGVMSTAHPTHFFVCAFLVADHSWGRVWGMLTKVLSKDESVKILLSMPRRVVVDYVVVAHCVRLLVALIVACRSCLVPTRRGGVRVK